MLPFIYNIKLNNFQEIRELLLQEYFNTIDNEVNFRWNGKDYFKGLNVDHNLPFYWDGEMITNIFITRNINLISNYCKKLSKELQAKLNLEDNNIDMKFHRFLKNTMLPWHLDYETQKCSINFMLSDLYAPIKFKYTFEDNEEIPFIYDCALINTSLPHAVMNTSCDRIMLKFGIVNRPFEEILEKLISEPLCLL